MADNLVQDNSIQGDMIGDDDHHPEIIRPKCFVIEMVIILFFMAHGIAIPVNYYYSENYVRKRLASDNYEHDEVFYDGYLPATNISDKVKQEMTTYLMYNKLADGVGIIPAICFGPVVDRVGRKIGLIIPTIGMLCKGVLFYAFISLELNIYFLLVGCAIESISGGFAVIFLSCLGIIADITPPGPVRTFRIAVLEGLNAVFTSVSIIVTSLWIENGDYRDPMIISVTLSACLLGLIIGLVPETLRSASTLRCSPKLLMRSINVYRNSEHYPNRKWKMLVALLCFVLTVSVNFTKPNIEKLVLRFEPFKWSSLTISLYISLGLILCWIKIIIDSKLLGKYLQDLSFAIIGSMSSISSLLLFAFVKNNAMAYCAAAVGVYIRMIIPMIRSFTSRHVLLQEQGSLFSGLAAVEVCTAAVMGFTTEYLYKETMSFSQGLVFFCMAGLMIVALGLFILRVMVFGLMLPVCAQTFAYKRSQEHGAMVGPINTKLGMHVEGDTAQINTVKTQSILLKVGTRSETQSGYETIPEEISPFERENQNFDIF